MMMRFNMVELDTTTGEGGSGMINGNGDGINGINVLFVLNLIQMFLIIADGLGQCGHGGKRWWKMNIGGVGGGHDGRGVFWDTA